MKITKRQLRRIIKEAKRRGPAWLDEMEAEALLDDVQEEIDLLIDRVIRDSDRIGGGEDLSAEIRAKAAELILTALRQRLDVW